MSNTFGKIYRLTSFGESHGKAIGGIIDGCPAGYSIDFENIQLELNRRKPGQSSITTPRNEEDQVQFLSGIFENKTLGTPIGFLVWNKDQKSDDYDNIKDIFRPSHADYTYTQKYGIRDHRGGGRSSARETIARIVGGAIAKQILSHKNIDIQAFTSQVGNITLNKSYKELDLNQTESNIVRCPDMKTAEQMIDLIKVCKEKGDSVGGKITCIIKNSPVGLGEPVFNKLHAGLASAMLSINACKTFELGDGAKSPAMFGSEYNDEFFAENKKVTTKTNHSGGIQGGISNGEDIVFHVAFKPVATILQKLNTIDNSLQNTTLTPQGRHDPCVLPRAVPIVEAMAAITLLDFYLLNAAYQNFRTND